MEFTQKDVGRVIIHSVYGMIATIIRVDNNKAWYREKASGGIASVDNENKHHWEFYEG